MSVSREWGVQRGQQMLKYLSRCESTLPDIAKVVDPLGERALALHQDVLQCDHAVIMPRSEP